MKFLLDDVNELGLHIELQNESELIRITLADDLEYKTIYLGEEELFELIGALHYIQKQLNTKK